MRGIPLLRGKNHLVGTGIEPSSPPREGAVGDDVVMAGAHEHHVLPTVLAHVPVHRGGIRKRQILAYSQSSEKT